MPRYVILQHEKPAAPRPGTHWDFMLEHDGVLRTWALSHEPQIGAEIAADQLPDHRLFYLDYEGPVSDGRGTVAQWDCGQYEMITIADNRLAIRLSGRRLNCTVDLLRAASGDQRWMFSFSM